LFLRSCPPASLSLIPKEQELEKRESEGIYFHLLPIVANCCYATMELLFRRNKRLRNNSFFPEGKNGFTKAKNKDKERKQQQTSGEGN